MNEYYHFIFKHQEGVRNQQCLQNARIITEIIRHDNTIVTLNYVCSYSKTFKTIHNINCVIERLWT